MMHRISSIKIEKYPILEVTFSDGVQGEVDLSPEIETKPLFEALKNKDLFQKVSIGPNGSCLGWRMNEVGNEIDLSAEGLRGQIETQIVHRWAEEYRSKKHAAE